MACRALIVALTACVLLISPAAAGATEPWACIDETEGFDAAALNEPHTLTAACTFDGDGHDLVLFEWDLDGDGSYERSTGATPTVTHTWTDRAVHLDATVHVGIRVTDAAGEVGTWAEPVRITDEINSWFTFQPQLLNPGDVVDLAAFIRPYVVDGRSWTYEWDLDGDGSFEHSSGLVPDATLVAPAEPGFYPVGLRVSDNAGNVSVVRREIEVLPRHPSRDQIVYDAPTNLGDTPVVSAAPPIPGAPFAPAPDPPADPEGDPVALPPTARLKRVDADRYGLRLHYVDGPKWSRWRATVQIPSKRAASYGLGRRKVVLAHGTIVFDGRGRGRSNRMRWTRGAYRLFRKVQFSRMDVLRKRVA